MIGAQLQEQIARRQDCPPCSRRSFSPPSPQSLIRIHPRQHVAQGFLRSPKTYLLHSSPPSEHSNLSRLCSRDSWVKWIEVGLNIEPASQQNIAVVVIRWFKPALYLRTLTYSSLGGIESAVMFSAVAHGCSTGIMEGFSAPSFLSRRIYRT
jgi:hypothetical protein